MEKIARLPLCRVAVSTSGRHGRIAQGTMRHPTHHLILLQPDIPAARTRSDSAAGNVRPAFSANVDDDFSIAGADLQRDEAIGAFGATAAESTDIAAHRD
jgi:hypothetical protein